MGSLTGTSGLTGNSGLLTVAQACQFLWNQLTATNRPVLYADMALSQTEYNARANSSSSANAVGFAPTVMGYSGIIAIPDGRLFILPGTGHRCAIYNPVTDTSVYPTDAFGTSGFAHYGGCLLNDGRVFCAPRASTVARVYDLANSAVTSGGTYPGIVGASNQPFNGCVKMLDGQVFSIPCTSTTARVYNPGTNTTTTPSVTFTGNYSFHGGALLADGRVFLNPRASQRARIYDPAGSGSVTLSIGDEYCTAASSDTGAADDHYKGCVTMQDGRILSIPNASRSFRIYDPATNSVSTPGATLPSGVAFEGGTLMPDGRIFCSNDDSAQTYGIYDPVADTLTTGTGNSSGGLGAIVMQDGRIALGPSPASNSPLRIVQFKTTSDLTCWSPWLSAIHNRV